MSAFPLHQIPLTLASASPRRKQLLEAAGFRPLVQPSNVPELIAEGEDGESYARRLARDKAEAVPCPPGGVVLAADTVVLAGHHILEKPAGDDDALRMLRLLSGRFHDVVTAFCLHGRGRVVIDAARTRVRFVQLRDEEIRDYVASGEPHGKAGAYAIQGLASKFIDRVEGCYFNVVGLPVSLFYRRLRELIQE